MNRADLRNPLPRGASGVRHSRFNRLLVLIVVVVAAIGGILVRDLYRSQADAREGYARLLRSLELLSELQYQMQEARRTLLYALVTSDSNRQVDYADRSRSADTPLFSVPVQWSLSPWSAGSRRLLYGPFCPSTRRYDRFGTDASGCLQAKHKTAKNLGRLADPRVRATDGLPGDFHVVLYR